MRRSSAGSLSGRRPGGDRPQPAIRDSFRPGACHGSRVWGSRPRVLRSKASACVTRRIPLELPDEQPFLPRLSGAGSLRRELEAVFAVAPSDSALAAYRDLLLVQNAAGKGSVSMRNWTWKRLKNRYLLDPSVSEFVAFRGAMDEAHDPSERGLLAFLMMARTDRLFRDVTLEIVSPLLDSADSLIAAEKIRDAIQARAEIHQLRWTDNSIRGVTSHLLSSAKDFGLLTGAASKRTQRVRPGPSSASFAVQLSRLEGLSDRQSLESRWFRLLGMSFDRVLSVMFDAARAGVLEFRFQADVAEITLRTPARGE